MGQALTNLEGSCLHDLFVYVLNDSECHSQTDCFQFDCETHAVADDASEISIEVENCCHVRKH